MLRIESYFKKANEVDFTEDYVDLHLQYRALTARRHSGWSSLTILCKIICSWGAKMLPLLLL